ncbi:MAG: divalent-cation tolerance protein CutA [Rhodospirillales bacterium]|jgi:periplasmic divalent cation tolerance protein
MPETALIYFTAPNSDEAKIIAETIISEHFAACANILGDVSSIFSWNGNIQNEQETAVFLKTTVSQIPALSKRICELHSYDQPCVIALPIIGGNKGFLDWIKSKTTNN